MAGLVTRVVFVGANKKPSFVTETCPLPSDVDLCEGELLVKIKLATICDADLDSLDGKWTKPIPSVMGHEGVGEVLISKRRDLKVVPGDRIVFSTFSRCESCVTCRQQLPIPCPFGVQYGYSALTTAASLSGTFASHVILRRGTHVTSVPAHVPDEVASSANCPLGLMVNVVETVLSRLTGVGDKKIAVIQGINIFAIYGCLLLKELAGFSEVYLTDSNLEQQKLAQYFGGIPSVDKKDGRRRSRLPPSSTVDIVILTNYQSDLIAEGMDLLRPGGMYVLASLNGQTKASTSISVEPIVKKGLSIHGICGSDKHHLDMAIEFLSKISSKYPLQDLISPKFSLHDLPSAIKTARSGLYCRVAITPEGTRPS